MKRTILVLAFALSCVSAYGEKRVDMTTDLQDTAPKFMLKDGEGKPASGICIDIMRLLEVGGNFKFRYTFTYTPNKLIESNIQSGESDVHFGWASTPERQKIATFGEELYKVTYLGVVRKDDKVDFKSVADLIKLGDQGTVLSVAGVASTANLKKIAGLKVDDEGKDMGKNLDKLAAGKGRVFIYQSLAIGFEMQKPANSNRFKVIKIDFGGIEAFNESPQYIVFSKKVPAETVQKINSAVVKSRKEIDAIVKKYVTL